MKKIGILIVGAALTTMGLWGCAKADPEFVHTTNTISSMSCFGTQTGSPIPGVIYEYDKNGNLVGDDFTQEEVEGGYGIVVFGVSESLKETYDLTKIYLTANVTFDEFITPTLTGRHDITGDGIIITVKSGVGTTRSYRVRGEYE